MNPMDVQEVAPMNASHMARLVMVVMTYIIVQVHIVEFIALAVVSVAMPNTICLQEGVASIGS